tara:strand:+ start:11739 stop:12158 length:420 start_codon:yes stop_codon:yes gene_type:complete
LKNLQAQIVLLVNGAHQTAAAPTDQVRVRLILVDSADRATVNSALAKPPHPATNPTATTAGVPSAVIPLTVTAGLAATDLQAPTAGLHRQRAQMQLTATLTAVSSAVTSIMAATAGLAATGIQAPTAGLVTQSLATLPR